MTAYSLRRFKRRLYEVLEMGASGDGLSRLVDSLLIALIFINVAAVIVGTVDDIARSYGDILSAIEAVSVGVFTIEYFARLWVANLHKPLRHYGPLMARVRYGLQGWAVVDLVAILPYYLSFVFGGGDLRVLLIFRLVRFLKIARFSPALRSLAMAIGAERKALLASLVILFGVILTAAAIMYMVERTAQPEAFDSLPKSLWWAAATLTTVGYGDVVPITALGKMVAGIFMIIGYGLFALPVGIVATAFAQEIHRRDFVVTWGMVARVPLFEELAAGEIAQIMRLLHSQVVERGAVIARAGEPAHSMYFVASGAVEVVLPGKYIRFEEGSFFGEIAVLHKTRRSADAIAASRCHLLVLDADDLHRLMEQKPSIARRIHEVAQSRLEPEPVVPGGDLAEEELEVAAEAAEGGGDAEVDDDGDEDENRKT